MKRQAAHPDDSIHLCRHQFSLCLTAARKLLALSLVQQCSSTGVIHPDLSFLCNFSEHLGSYFLKNKPKSENYLKLVRIRRLGGLKVPPHTCLGLCYTCELSCFEFVPLKPLGMVTVGRLQWGPRNTLLNLVPHRSSRSLLNFSLLCFSRDPGLSKSKSI